MLAAAAGAALLVAVFAALMLVRMQSQALVGTDLQSTPAPPFQLVDQDGQWVSLQQFRGKPVVLTFLYTHCPDACPLIADQVHQSLDLLGPDAAKVAVLAVSTDPIHDDRVSATDFVRLHSLQGQMRYLLGSPAELSAVWKAYYIGVSPGGAENDLIHSEAVFVIDKAGKERALLGLPFRAQDLADDVRKLIEE